MITLNVFDPSPEVLKATREKLLAAAQAEQEAKRAKLIERILRERTSGQLVNQTTLLGGGILANYEFKMKPLFGPQF